MFGGSLDFLLNVKGQILGLVALSIICWLDVRRDLSIVAMMTLCKREFKERKKGRSIIEFLFLTNFKDVVPKVMFVWLYCQFFWIPIGVTIITGMSYAGESIERIIRVTQLLFLITVIPSLIYSLVFVKHDKINGSTPRFISHRHVMTKKHTQPQRNSNRPKKNTKPKKK